MRWNYFNSWGWPNYKNISIILKENYKFDTKYHKSVIFQ